MAHERAASSSLLFAAALAAAGVAWSGPLSSEAHALQCGTSIVVLGDSMAAVRARCGEPAAVEVRHETRLEWIVPPSPGFLGQSRTVTVEIALWTYDFGAGRYVEQLEFRDGQLARMRPVGPSRGSR
jgi:hypothetical protein